MKYSFREFLVSETKLMFVRSQVHQAIITYVLRGKRQSNAKKIKKQLNYFHRILTQRRLKTQRKQFKSTLMLILRRFLTLNTLFERKYN